MRRLAFALVMLAWSTLNSAASKEDAEAAFARFLSSFTTGNQEQIVSLFAPDALFYGTNSIELVTTTQGIRDYFTRALSAAGVKANPLGHTSVVLSDNVVAISGKWQSERMVDGKLVANAPFRVSVVMQKRADGWKIAQFHNSPTPAPAAPSLK